MSAEKRLESLVGQRLGSVVFVEDYVQLILDHAGLSLLNTPRLIHEGIEIGGEDPRSAMSYVAMIGNVVHDVEFARDSHLALEFENGDRVVVPLAPGDYRHGPEGLLIEYDDAMSVF